MKGNKEYEWELVEVLQRVSSDKSLLYDFLEDLLTPYELMDLATRWQIVKLLFRHIPQRQIARHLHVGIATVTRGSRVLLNKNSGFNKILRKYNVDKKQ